MDITAEWRLARRLLDQKVSPEVAYWAGWLAGFDALDRRTAHRRFFRSEEIKNAWSKGFRKGVARRLRMMRQRRH